MIIFADNKTGQIVGKINGRRHTQDELDSWMGPYDTTEEMKANLIKIVIPWEAVNKRVEVVGREVIVAYEKSKGGLTPVKRKIKRNVIRVDWEPKHEQKDLISKIEKGEDIYKYRVNIKTMRLVKKLKKKKNEDNT